MLKLLRRKTDATETQKGQALVEFALTLPILLFLILGLIDFGIVLFSYSHASSSLRNALRKAEVLGYVQGGGIAPYLDCTTMKKDASKGWFSTDQDVEISYFKADGSHEYDCDDVNADHSLVGNGDLIHIKLTAKVHPMFLRYGTLNLTFEGERTIMRTIPAKPNSGGSGSGHPDPSLPKPPSPTSFVASANCASGLVSFSWYWGTTDPMPAKAEIRDTFTNNIVKTITDTSSTICTDCAAIGAPEARSFYIVAYNDGSPASLPSLSSDVACPAPIPPAPGNVKATVDCSPTGGIVEYTWNWPGSSPQPERIEVHDADTDALVLDMVIDSDGDATCGGGLCWDEIPNPGNRTYYMIAFYGMGDLETAGPHSNDTYVECVPNGTLTVQLINEQTSTSLCNYGTLTYSGKNITIVGTNGYSATRTTSSGSVSIATFNDVPPGTYTVTIPSSWGSSSNKRYPHSVSRNAMGCAAHTSSTYVTTVASDETVNLVFGYGKP